MLFRFALLTLSLLGGIQGCNIPQPTPNPRPQPHSPVRPPAETPPTKTDRPLNPPRHSPHDLRTDGPVRPHQPIPLRIGFLEAVPALPLLFRVDSPSEFLRHCPIGRSGITHPEHAISKIRRCLSHSSLTKTKAPDADWRIDAHPSSPEIGSLTLIAVLPKEEASPGKWTRIHYPPGGVPGLYLWGVLSPGHLTLAPIWITPYQGWALRTSQEVTIKLAREDGTGVPKARFFEGRDELSVMKTTTDSRGIARLAPAHPLPLGILAEQNGIHTWIPIAPAPPSGSEERVYLRAFPAETTPGQSITILIQVEPAEITRDQNCIVRLVGPNNSFQIQKTVQLDRWGRARQKLTIPTSTPLQAGEGKLLFFIGSRIHRGSWFLQPDGPRASPPPPRSSRKIPSGRLSIQRKLLAPGEVLMAHLHAPGSRCKGKLTISRDLGSESSPILDEIIEWTGSISKQLVLPDPGRYRVTFRSQEEIATDRVIQLPPSSSKLPFPSVPGPHLDIERHPDHPNSFRVLLQHETSHSLAWFTAETSNKLLHHRGLLTPDQPIWFDLSLPSLLPGEKVYFRMHHKTPSGWKTIDRTFASSPPPTILPTSKLFEYTETLDFLSSPRIHSFFSLFPLPGRFTLSEDLSFPGQAVYLPQRDRRSTIRRIDALTLHMLTALRQKEFRTAIWLAEDILRHFPDHDTAQYAAETARRALSIERAPKTGVLSSQDPEKRIERTLPLNLKGLLLETAFRSLEYATRIEIQLDPFLRQQSDWSTTRVDFETRGASARHVLDRLATRNHLAYRFHRDSLIVSTPNRISTPALQKLLLSDSLPSATPPGLLNRLQVTLADGSILPFSPVQPPLTSPPGVRHVRSGIHKIRSTFYSDANNKLIETREVLPPPGNLSWNARIPRTLRIGDRPLCPIEIRSRSSFRGRLRSSTGSSPEIHFEPDSPTTLWTPLNGPGPQHFQLGPKSWTFNIGTVSPNTRRSELVSGTLSPHTPSKSWTSEWLPQTITHLHLYPSPAAFLPELLKSLTHPASRDAESKIIRRLAPFLALEWSRRWPGGAPPWLLSAIQDALHAELPDWPEPDPDTSLFNSPLQKTAWIFEQILRARNLGLAIPENMIAGYLETVRNRQDSQDPISQWSLLLCESLINPSESVDRCIQLLSSTPLETIDSRGLSIALECCLILKLEEESTALRNRILDRKNTREPYSFWGREGHPEWSQDSFSITNRVLRGLSSSPGAHPEEILRGFGYLLARRTRGPGWGTDRNSFEILLTILSLPYPASLSPETSWEIQIGSDRWKIKAQSGGPQIHPYQGSSPDSRLFSPTLSNGTSPIFLSIAYQPLLRQPNVPSRIERRFTPVPSLGPTTYLVQLVSDPPLASGAYRLEEPLPPASRLIATTPMSREDEESLRIEPSLTLDLHQTISKSKTIFFSYLIECSIPGTYQLPPTRMSPIDRPEASAWGFPSTIRIPAPTQPR